MKLRKALGKHGSKRFGGWVSIERCAGYRGQETPDGVALDRAFVARYYP